MIVAALVVLSISLGDVPPSTSRFMALSDHPALEPLASCDDERARQWEIHIAEGPGVGGQILADVMLAPVNAMRTTPPAPDPETKPLVFAPRICNGPAWTRPAWQ